MTDLNLDAPPIELPGVQARLLAAGADAALSEMARADTKAATLLATFSLPVGGVAWLSTGTHLPPYAAAALWTGTGLLIAAITLLLWVVRPNLNGALPDSFIDFAARTPADIADGARQLGACPNELLLRQAVRAHGLSALALRRYRRVRVATDLMLAGFGLLVAALIATKITTVV